MAFIIKDRIKEGTTTTGTGDIALGGAPVTFESFQSYMTNGDTTYYAIVHTVSGIDEWEVGLGTWNTGNTLTRTTVLAGSNGTSAVDFSAGTKDIFMTYPASKAVYTDASGDIDINGGTIDGTTIGANSHTTGKFTTLQATGNVDFDGYIDMAPIAHPTHSEGRVYYDSSHKSLSFQSDIDGVEHELGLEEHVRVYNNTGATLAKGKPVYWSGNQNDVPTVALANATSSTKYNVQGLTANEIANNSYGYVIVSGLVYDIDTSGLNAGENFFAGLTDGALQNAPPSYPNYPMCLGWVIKSDSTTGIVLVNQQNHSVNSFRVQGDTHVGGDLTISGDLTVNGTQTATSSNNVSLGASFQYLNAGDTIGESNTAFTGSGLDDATLVGHFSGTASTTYYVRIDGTGTPDTFEWSKDNFSTTEATGVSITGNDQALDNGISVNFGTTTGHTSGDVWSGTAAPANVDTGIFTNYNTGGSGVGYTHTGIFWDASTAKWTVLSEYDPEPEGTINLADASVAYATFKAGTFEGNLSGNVTGNLTGTATSANALATARTIGGVSFDGSANIDLPGVNTSGNQDTSGNAATATALATARTIQLSGDVTGSATFDGSANINITAAVQDDSHAHVISNVDGLQAALDGKTPTTRTITAGNGLTGGGDLSANRTIDIDSSYTGFDGRYYTETEADSRFVNVTGDTMSGDLTLNSVSATINMGYNGGPHGINFYDDDSSLKWGFYYRTSPDSISFELNGSSNKWQLETNGNVTQAGKVYVDTNQRVFADNYHPNADKWTTARTLSLSGDASGSVSWDGSANATLSVTVANDSHTHDGRYYTETEADSRFANVAGDTFTGDVTIDSASAWNTGNGMLNVGGTGDGRLQVRHIWGKSGSSAGTDDLWLQYSNNNQHVQIGASGGGNNLYVAGELYAQGYFGGQRVFHDGYHPNADKWTTARTLTLSGDASGSVSWDGSANATLSVTVANDSHSHSNYITSNANDSMSGILTFTSTNNAFAEYNGSGTAPYFRFKTSGTNNGYIQFTSSGVAYFWNDRANQGIRVQSGASGLSWYDGSAYRTVWHASNDGSGSGLDADLLDGQHASAFQAAASELTWVDQATGNYGTIKVDDDRGVSWAGYAIRDDWVFMSNGAAEAGIFNDTNNEWGIKMFQNARTALYYNGDEQFRTESAGVSTDRGLRVGGFGNPHNSNALEITGGTGEKIVLSGNNDPYIRWQEGTTDRFYIQWRAGEDAPLFRNQQGDHFDFMPDAATGAVSLRLRGSDNDTWGYVYATDSQEVGFLDEGGSWAYRIANDSSHEWRISNGVEMTLNTSELNMSGNNINNISNMYVANTIYHYGDTDTYINFGTDLMYIYTGNVPKVTVNNAGVRLGDNGNGYFRPVSGNYGSIEIDGGAHSSWEGYSIGGRAVFMHDNASRLGLFDDVYNHWGFFYDFNGDANLTYAGSIKLQTYSGGVSITGDLNSTSDIRYKKNIETIDSALEKVQSLRGVTFDWDNDAFEEKEHTKKPNFTERATGVIAQDVEKVLPEAVHENKDGFKNVAYGNMVGLLIEAIKEQQEQIDALKTQLNG